MPGNFGVYALPFSFKRLVMLPFLVIETVKFFFEEYLRNSRYRNK